MAVCEKSAFETNFQNHVRHRITSCATGVTSDIQSEQPSSPHQKNYLPREYILREYIPLQNKLLNPVFELNSKATKIPNDKLSTGPKIHAQTSV